MKSREIKQTAVFKRQYKKLYKNELEKTNEAIRAIAENPDLGEMKKGDLAGVRVYKFNVLDKVYLLVYRQEQEVIILLLALGVHENFYRDLKNQ